MSYFYPIRPFLLSFVSLNRCKNRLFFPILSTRINSKMSPPVTAFYILSCIELTAFYIFDFIFAQALNRYKRDFPELDDCAPEDTPDVDSSGFVRVVANGAINMYQGREGGSAERRDYDEPSAVEEPLSLAAAAGANPVHTVVVVASVVGPLCSVLMTVLPHSASWMAQERPTWLRDIFVAVGLALDVLFIARTLSVIRFSEVTKTLWLSLMWFRLDFMLLMAAVALVGFGSIVVGLCLLAVGLYLAKRVMQLEKRLASLQLETQLLREDGMDVERVLVPGSEESKKAVGHGDGYTNLA